MQEMQEMVLTRKLPHATIRKWTHAIRGEVLRRSHHLDNENFTIIHPDDLECMFHLYDQTFFDGKCLNQLSETPLSFRLSKRMTSVAGSTARIQKKDRQRRTSKVRYEITISTTLLFQTFRERTRPIVVNGVQCQCRMDALQRVMEHEIVHLVEMILWKQSKCTADRFQSIALRFFGHTDHTHRLITPREHAATKYGVRTGDRVSFRFDGQHLVGVVNRITRRATVLVEDPAGECYSDGKRYHKYYVPVAQLKALDREPGGP